MTAGIGVEKSAASESGRARRDLTHSFSTKKMMRAKPKAPVARAVTTCAPRLTNPLESLRHNRPWHRPSQDGSSKGYSQAGRPAGCWLARSSRCDGRRTGGEAKELRTFSTSAEKSPAARLTWTRRGCGADTGTGIYR